MRIFLFDWDEESARGRAAALAPEGFKVELESRDGGSGVRAVLACPPDVIVLSLEKRPSHSRETAGGIRGYKAGRAVPMLFVGGAAADIKKTKARVPGAMFVAPERLLAALQALRDSP